MGILGSEHGWGYRPGRSGSRARHNSINEKTNTIYIIIPTSVYSFLVNALGISETFVDILIPGILNTFVWLTTLVLTQNKEEELHAKQWIQEVGVLSEFKSGKNWLLFIGLSLILFLFSRKR
jgi:TRAP-type C4-dicarboxylate transport system permease large subunit